MQTAQVANKRLNEIFAIEPESTNQHPDRVVTNQTLQ